jgi:hypothetical protein
MLVFRCFSCGVAAQCFGEVNGPVASHRSILSSITDSPRATGATALKATGTTGETTLTDVVPVIVAGGDYGEVHFQ